MMSPISSAALRLAAALLVVCLLHCSSQRGEGESPAVTEPETISGPLNVLLIVWDTARADRLSLYGYARSTTPHLDALAREALVYEQAISPGNWTVPSHASIFTGLPVRAHGAVAPTKWLDESYETLAETLGSLRYDTYAFTANPHASEKTNLLQGFGRIDHAWKGPWKQACRASTEAHLIEEDRSTMYSPGRKGANSSFGRGESKIAASKNCGDVTTEALLSWLDARPAPDRPFFAFLNYMDAHTPRLPSASSRARVASAERVSASLAVDAEPTRQFMHMFGVKAYSEDELQALGDVYDATLVDLDTATAYLLDALRERGLLERTVVILTSDHGEALGEHGQLDHKYNLYDPLIRVPLVMRLPQPGAPNGRIRDPVSTRDIHPTVLGLVAGSPAAPVGGARPLPTESSAESRERAVYAEMISPVEGALKQVSWFHRDLDWAPWLRTMHSIRQSEHKLITISDGTRELYQLADDPEERSNIASEEVGRAGDLEGDLKAWLATVPRAKPRPRNERDRPAAADDVDESQLRALGYLDDAVELDDWPGAEMNVNGPRDPIEGGRRALE